MSQHRVDLVKDGFERWNRGDPSWVLEHMHPEVEWMRSGVPDDIFEEAQSLYFPRRYYFASDRPETELAAAATQRTV